MMSSFFTKSRSMQMVLCVMALLALVFTAWAVLFSSKPDEAIAESDLKEVASAGSTSTWNSPAESLVREGQLPIVANPGPVSDVEKSIIFHGKLEDGNGRAVSGAQVSLEGKLNPVGAPQLVQCATNESGAFAVTTSEHYAKGTILDQAFTMQIQKPGFATANWSFGHLNLGAPQDLGVIQLLATGVFEGRVLYSDGAPVSKGSLTLHSAEDYAMGRIPEIASSLIGEDGSFRMEHAPEGTCRMHVITDATGFMDLDTRCVILPRETLTQDIVLPMSSREGRVVAMILPEGQAALPGLSGVRLVSKSDDGEVIYTGSPRPHIEGRFEWLFVGHGSCVIEVDDVLFVPARMEFQHQAAKTIVNLEVKGSSAIELELEGGAPPDTELFVELSDSNGKLIQKAWPPDGASLLIDGLVANTYNGKLLRATDGVAQFEVLKLKPGEVRRITLALNGKGNLEGTIVGGLQSLVLGEMKIGLYAPPAEFTPRLQFLGDRERPERGRPSTSQRYITTPAADGIFRFANIAPGEYLVAARRGPGLWGATGPIHLAPSGRPAQVVVEVPEGGVVHGAVVNADGNRPLALFARLEGLPNESKSLMIPVPIDASGAYRIGPIGACEVEFLAEFPGHVVRSSNIEVLSEMKVPGHQVMVGKIASRGFGEQQLDLDLEPCLSGNLRVRIGGFDQAQLELIGFLYAKQYPKSPPVVTRAPAGEELIFVDVVAGEYELLVHGMRSLSLDWVASLGVLKITREDLLEGGLERAFTLKLVNCDLSLQQPTDGAELALADQRLEIVAVGAGRKANFQVRTDAQGRISMVLPMGEYELRCRGLAEGEWWEGRFSAQDEEPLRLRMEVEKR